MKKITRSLMTLVLLSIAGVANAQQYETWIDVSDQVQGWVHEWRTMESQTNAEALVDEEEDGAYKIYVRSYDEAEEAGNATRVDGSKPIASDNFASWDSQFFITFGENNVLKAGDKIQLTMNVKATAAQEGESQAHGAPGAYNHWACVGNVPFTTDWVEFKSAETEITSDMAGENGMYTVALNLAKGAANTCYFKDIVVKIWKKKPVENWMSIIKNGDFERSDETKNYIVTQHATGGGRAEATIVDGIGCADAENNVDGTKGITFQSSGKEGLDWDTQFFIFFDKKLPQGTQVHIKFDYKAKEAHTSGTQIHLTPGDYKHWNALGDINFKTEWQTFDKTINIDCNNYADGMQSIAFNMSQSPRIWNIYYFDNFVAEVAEDVYEGLADSEIATFETKGKLEILPEDPLAAVKADLEAAITKGGLFTDYLKTADSFEALQTAISDGETALAAEDATQASLEAALTAINNAIDGLTYVEGYTKLTGKGGMFKRYASIDPDAEIAEENQDCSYDLGKSSGLPYGDGNVSEIMWADLTEYAQLIVVAVDGTPRFCMNRLEAGGQQAETQEDSKMLDINPNNGYTWSTEKYQTVDGNTYTIDLKAIVADYGFARLHSIKGSNYGNATIIDMILVKAPETVTATVTDALWATFVPAKDVTVPEGVTAYAVTLDESNTFVNLTEVTEVTAGTPVILNTEEAAEFTFATAEGASFSADNDLQVATDDVIADGSTIFVLANGSKGPGFYLLANGEVITAGKVYLVVADAAREFISFGEATAIKSIETAKANGAIYNLAGQQVKSAQKGIFIIDGKKVIK